MDCEMLHGMVNFTTNNYDFLLAYQFQNINKILTENCKFLPHMYLVPMLR